MIRHQLKSWPRKRSTLTFSWRYSSTNNAAESTKKILEATKAEPSAPNVVEVSPLDNLSTENILSQVGEIKKVSLTEADVTSDLALVQKPFGDMVSDNKFFLFRPFSESNWITDLNLVRAILPSNYITLLSSLTLKIADPLVALFLPTILVRFICSRFVLQTQLNICHEWAEKAKYLDEKRIMKDLKVDKNGNWILDDEKMIKFCKGKLPVYELFVPAEKIEKEMKAEKEKHEFIDRNKITSKDMRNLALFQQKIQLLDVKAQINLDSGVRAKAFQASLRNEKQKYKNEIDRIQEKLGISEIERLEQKHIRQIVAKYGDFDNPEAQFHIKRLTILNHYKKMWAVSKGQIKTPIMFFKEFGDNVRKTLPQVPSATNGDKFTQMNTFSRMMIFQDVRAIGGSGFILTSALAYSLYGSAATSAGPGMTDLTAFNPYLLFSVYLPIQIWSIASTFRTADRRFVHRPVMKSLKNSNYSRIIADTQRWTVAAISTGAIVSFLNYNEVNGVTLLAGLLPNALMQALLINYSQSDYFRRRHNLPTIDEQLQILERKNLLTEKLQERIREEYKMREKTQGIPVPEEIAAETMIKRTSLSFNSLSYEGLKEGVMGRVGKAGDITGKKILEAIKGPNDPEFNSLQKIKQINDMKIQLRKHNRQNELIYDDRELDKLYDFINNDRRKFLNKVTDRVNTSSTTNFFKKTFNRFSNDKENRTELTKEERRLFSRVDDYLAEKERLQKNEARKLGSKKKITALTEDLYLEIQKAKREERQPSWKTVDKRFEEYNPFELNHNRKVDIFR